MMFRRLLAALFAGLLLFGLAACGDDDVATDDETDETTEEGTDDTTEEESEEEGEDEGEGEEAAGDVEAEIAAAIIADPDPDFPVTEDQANCIANGIVDGIGEDRLEELGLVELFSSDEQVEFADIDLDEDEVDSLASTFTECLDFRELMMEQFGASLTDEQKACVEEAITDEAIHEFFVVGFSGGDTDAAAEELGALAQECAA
jgi:hypothetical protein